MKSTAFTLGLLAGLCGIRAASGMPGSRIFARTDLCTEDLNADCPGLYPDDDNGGPYSTEEGCTAVCACTYNCNADDQCPVCQGVCYGASDIETGQFVYYCYATDADAGAK